MSYYFPGYDTARERVSRMDRVGLLRQIDSLYGRHNLPDDFTDDDLRAEALDQTRREFTDRSSEEYERVQFWTKMARLTSAHAPGREDA